ncbi:MAG: hypothetical protein BroJett018_37610 [Chloroflexota bacterium]|nr:hypothetical protein [Chloroflexota bacterium]NOG66491.1 hypothetical protein [Chloroflexota bacterium]GIK65967.1 MAG: hypothetical protein BroJett018_37610 [Chloroflexota bacterium]
MPILRLTDHRLAPGIQTVSYMTTNETRIRLFPLQTDQGTGAPAWAGPDYHLGMVSPRYSRYRMDANQNEVGDGPLFWDPVFGFWTNDMLAYVKTTFPHNGPVTVMAYDHQDTPVYFTAILLHPIEGEHMQWTPTGWMEIKLRLRRGVVIT